MGSAIIIWISQDNFRVLGHPKRDGAMGSPHPDTQGQPGQPMAVYNVVKCCETL